VIELTIDQNPTPWTPARVWRTGFHFDPRSAEKKEAIRQIRAQYSEPPIGGFFFLSFLFFVPIPLSKSHAYALECLEGKIFPTRCDTTNCQKFYEDCLRGVVIDDDRHTVGVFSFKTYDVVQKVMVRVFTTSDLHEIVGLSDKFLWQDVHMKKKDKVEKVMHEFKEGKLHRGSKKGPEVNSGKQAVAIALGEARKAGDKIPKR
jgi:Holliday junction resolvase RusA-like endonuclease